VPLFHLKLQEQLTGSAFGASEFSQSIKRAVQEGHTFKVCCRDCVCTWLAAFYPSRRSCCQGYPICFSHTSTTLMMAAFRQATVAMDIIKVSSVGGLRGVVKRNLLGALCSLGTTDKRRPCELCHSGKGLSLS